MLARKKMFWIMNLSFNQIINPFFYIVYSIRLIFNIKIKDSYWGGGMLKRGMGSG